MAYVTPRTWVPGELVTAAQLNQDVRDNISYLYARANFFICTGAGVLGGGADQGFHLRGYGDITFGEAEVLVKTAPTGQALIVDINKNGTSLWSATQANRPQIAAGATAGETTSFDTTTATDDDVLTMDVDQVGSGTAGSDLTVVLWYV